MKKAIISFDMPSTCADCPFCFKSDKIGTGEKYTYKQLYRCSMCPSYIINIYLPDIVETKPNWCPLQESTQAYDLEAVVKRLEELKNDFIENMRDGDYLRGNVNFAVNAIEIVRNGGVKCIK